MYLVLDPYEKHRFLFFVSLGQSSNIIVEWRSHILPSAVAAEGYAYQRVTLSFRSSNFTINLTLSLTLISDACSVSDRCIQLLKRPPKPFTTATRAAQDFFRETADLCLTIVGLDLYAVFSMPLL